MAGWGGINFAQAAMEALGIHPDIQQRIPGAAARAAQKSLVTAALTTVILSHLKKRKDHFFPPPPIVKRPRISAPPRTMTSLSGDRSIPWRTWSYDRSGQGGRQMISRRTFPMILGPQAAMNPIQNYGRRYKIYRRRRHLRRRRVKKFSRFRRSR